MKRVEKIIFLIDVSLHMKEKVDETNITILEQNLKIVTSRIWRLIMSNPLYLFSVFFIGESQSANNCN